MLIHGWVLRRYFEEKLTGDAIRALCVGFENAVTRTERSRARKLLQRQLFDDSSSFPKGGLRQFKSARSGRNTYRLYWSQASLQPVLSSSRSSASCQLKNIPSLPLLGCEVKSYHSLAGQGMRVYIVLVGTS